MAAEALPVSPPPMLPPPALKARIMAEVEREAALLASAGKPDRAAAPAKREAPLVRRRLAACRCPRWRALACVTLLARAGRSARVLFGGGSDARTIAVPVDAAAGLGASSRSTDDGATLVANGLPAPPAGKTYMVWLHAPGPRARADVGALHAAPRRLGHGVA